MSKINDEKGQQRSEKVERLLSLRAEAKKGGGEERIKRQHDKGCLLYTSDAADE